MTTLIVNTRSAVALIRAGIPISKWNIKNMTGDPATEARLQEQLNNNGLDDTGTPEVVPKSVWEQLGSTGGGDGAAP